MKARVIKAIKNKYVFTPLIFLVWMAFFNDIDLFFILQSKRELKSLQEEVQYFQYEIDKTRESLHDLTTNAATLEKFARETYYMKKPNEDIFIVRITD